MNQLDKFILYHIDIEDITLTLPIIIFVNQSNLVQTKSEAYLRVPMNEIFK